MRRSRFFIAVIMAGLAIVSYYGMRQENPVTGEVQHVGLSPEQEVVLGFESAPQMAEQMGGVDADASVQADVSAIGERVSQTMAGRTPYKFRFTVLADPETVNAFALPGGPIFITRGLLARLENEAQLAGVLGHEVGHVINRDSAEQIAKSQLAQGLVGAVGVATTDESGRGQQAAQLAAFVAQLVQLKYGRNDELGADAMGVDLMTGAGYDPRALVGVMKILSRASGGSRQPEFFSTHPDPGNRGELIRARIAQKFPGGVPDTLTVGRPIRLASR